MRKDKGRLKELNLKKIREQQGFTQTQVAEWLGKTRFDVCKIENGVFLPTKQDYEILKQRFHCSDVDLLSESDCFVATTKIFVATKPKTKSRVNTYNYHVRLEKGKFPLLEKNELKKLGFNTNADFFLWAYKKLQKKCKKQGAS